MTDRRGAADRIQAEELYRSLVEASPDPILMWDLEGRILMANQQAAIAFGLSSQEELQARAPTIFDRVRAEHRSRARENFEQTPADGSSRGHEYQVALDSGATLIVEVNSTVVRGPGGAPSGFVSVVRDVTERKQLEEHLRTQCQLGR